ncbi:extensin family protein [Cognatishimia sp. WU-CL00825]|uniref:extensin-like domain-containing protein n=1 Tax=Cognatishimia sp. WU-CL00825 TaxID=3127658 RepID=UPI003102B7C1
MWLRAGVIVFALIGSVVHANAPAISLRPVARIDIYPVALPTFAPAVSLRPVIRPRSVHRAKQPRIDRVFKSKAQSANNIGRICRDRDLQGVVVGRVPAKLRGCGIDNAVKLFSVSGVRLSMPVVMECGTAKSLKTWVEGGLAKAVGGTGGGVSKLQVAAGYACRTRNSRPGAKISEHGKGRAIDISAIYLENGDRISVLNDWGRGKNGRMLKKMHQSACGPFGTVLGPESDRHHKDHFHFDVARHRSGPYCR